jgi:hypothetical protein
MMKTSESKTVTFRGQEISIAARFPLGNEAARLIGIVTCPQCTRGVELYPFMYPTCPECSHEWAQGLWYIPVNSTTTKYKVGDAIALTNSPVEQHPSQHVVKIVAIEGTKLICRDEAQILDVEQRFCPKCESLNSHQMHDDCDRYEDTWYRCQDCGCNHSSVINWLDDDGDEEGWVPPM